MEGDRWPGAMFGIVEQVVGMDTSEAQFVLLEVKIGREVVCMTGKLKQKL